MASAPSAVQPRQLVGGPEYLCECGHRLSVIGGGRHRVYFERGLNGQDAPVMDRACPACARGLPGKNPP